MQKNKFSAYLCSDSPKILFNLHMLIGYRITIFSYINFYWEAVCRSVPWTVAVHHKQGFLLWFHILDLKILNICSDPITDAYSGTQQSWSRCTLKRNYLSRGLFWVNLIIPLEKTKKVRMDNCPYKQKSRTPSVFFCSKYNGLQAT